MRLNGMHALTPTRPRFALAGVVALGLAAAPWAMAQALAQAPANPPAGEAPAKADRAIVVPAPPLLPPAAPKADPRTVSQALRDKRAFGRCLLAAQSREAQDTGFQPGFEDPLERCRRLTSMQNESAPPTARQ